MSTKPAAIPLFGDAYLADTRHLSTEEHGAYLLLMMAAWRQDDCGLPMDDKKLARIVGLTEFKWGKIKDTILEFWTVRDGRIYQERLLKEWDFVSTKSAKNREAAKARWDRQDTENKQSGSCERTSERISDRNAPPPPPTEEVIEANASIAQNDVSGAQSNPPSKNLFGEPEPEPAEEPNLKPEHIVEVWNDTAKKLGKPQVRDLTPERRQTLKARIANHSIEDFQTVLAAIERSPFLRGDTGWRGCTFDWVFKKANFQKILEGNYDG